MMDLDAVRVFVKVAELASFTRAAEQLSMPKARVSVRVSELEAQIGAQLLQRTTRQVRLTQDGEQFLDRCRRLLVEADDLQSMFQQPQGGLRGRIRVDFPISIARDIILPRLPDFLALHPQLDVQLSATDRRVDLVRDGFDFILRIGTLRDSGLVAKRVGLFSMRNCASPAYLRKYGTPRTLDDLDQHLIVRYSLDLSAADDGFESFDGERYVTRAMRSVVTVNNTDAYRSACLAGLGIVQSPSVGMRDLLREGRLVEVLPEHRCAPMPVSLIYSSARTVSKRARAMMTWLAQILEPHLTEAGLP